MKDTVAAIIVAGGSGKRMGMNIKKQYIRLADKEILAHTIEAFEKCEVVDEIIVVVSEDEIREVTESIVERYQYKKVKDVVSGGAERQDSVYNGLLATQAKYVMIHDGARPFIRKETIISVLEKTKETGASVVAVPVKDTIKICNVDKQKIEETPRREKLWAIQTPQSFERNLLMKAYEFAKETKLQVTDDSMIVEAYGKDVYITPGDYMNIKITTPEDLIIGEAFIARTHKE